MRKLLPNFVDNPYYGTILKNAGLTCESIEKIEDIDEVLSKLPIIRKNDVQNNNQVMLNKNAKGILSDSSGGSTGLPVNFYHDEHWLAEMAASVLINDIMQGWYFFRRHVKLWGSPKDIKEINSPAARMLTWIKNRRFYDTFDMSAERMWSYHNDMQKFKPKVIYSYASSIYIFAKFIESNNIKPDYPTVSIITSAECLSDIMRAQIEKVFHVPVFDRYGAREVGCIAGECKKHNGMHLHMYDHIIECLDPVSRQPVWDKLGIIVITDLNNYSFPFIRYEIGDMGILSKEVCSCGRQTYLLKKIVGRISDTITTKTGRLIHGEYFTHAFYGIESIKKFQFIQEERDKYTLNVVKSEKFQEQELNQAITEIYEAVGLNSTIDVHFLDDIPVTKSGKYRFTISKV
ncbi:MAG: hypothetical protein AB1847_19320 [bacterium]